MKRAIITGETDGEHLFIDEDLGYTMMGSVMRDERGILRTKLHFMLGHQPAMAVWRFLNEYRKELIEKNKGE